MKDSAVFDKIGAARLRAVIADFYDRLFADVMIGFMFQGKDKQLLIEREWELAAALFGAPGITYRGRPMRVAHAQHTIFGGHFERRVQILREAMRDHAVDPEVQRVWLDHTESLRAQVTRDKGSECATTLSAGPKLGIAVATPAPDAVIKLGRRPR
ncbi:MAG: group 1 truncated hemoglobin [Kofleriaceae bacterium]